MIEGWGVRLEKREAWGGGGGGGEREVGGGGGGWGVDIWVMSFFLITNNF